MIKGQHVDLGASRAIGPTRHLKKWPLVSNNAEKHASWVQFRHVYPRNSRWWIFCFHEQLSKPPVDHSCIWWNSVLKKLKRPHAGKLVPSLVRVFTHLDMFPKSSETDWNHLINLQFLFILGIRKFGISQMSDAKHESSTPASRPCTHLLDFAQHLRHFTHSGGQCPEGSRGPLQGTRLFHEAPGEVDIPTLLGSWLFSRWTFPAGELQVVD